MKYKIEYYDTNGKLKTRMISASNASSAKKLLAQKLKKDPLIFYNQVRRIIK